MAKPRNPDECFTLFIILPSETVCTLRDLPSGIYVNDVKCRLELSAGIPAHIYMLVYPDGECLSDRERLLIQENVRDGYLLRVLLHNSWENLYLSVLRNNTEHVCHNGGVHLKGGVVVGSTESDKVDMMVTERANVALYVASYMGLTKMCSMLLSLGIDVNGRTRFGRSAVHAAVCKDHVIILNMLMNNNADTGVRDVYGQTPVDVARFFESYQCEKGLRLSLLNLRGSSKAQGCITEQNYSGAHRKLRVSSVPNKILSERNPGTRHADRHKATSATEMNRCRVNSPQTKLTIDLPLNHGTQTNGYRLPRGEGYWVVSQNTPVIDRKSYNLLEKRAPNKTIRVKSLNQLSITGQIRSLKFKKDLENLNINNSDFTVKAISVSENGHSDCVSMDIASNEEPKRLDEPDSENVNKDENNTEQRNEQIGTEDLQEQNMLKRSSLRSNSPKPSKTVRFSAKARSLKNLPNPETMESFKQMKRRIHLAVAHARPESKTCNGITHERWLQHKNKLEKKMRPQISSSSSEDDSSHEEDSNAFKEWLQRKIEGPQGPPRHPTGNRPLPGIIQIGSTMQGDGRNPDPSLNIRAYKEWLKNRRKLRKGTNVDRMKTMEEFMENKRLLEEKRQELLITAISFDEWMDHSEDRKSVIRQILKADFEQLKRMEQEKLKKRSPHQISHDQWKEGLRRRIDQEKLRLEIHKKQEEDRNPWGKTMTRSSAAVSHKEWLKQKRTLQVTETKVGNSPRESTYGSESTRKEAELSYDIFSKSESCNDASAHDGHDVIHPLRHPRVVEIASC